MLSCSGRTSPRPPAHTPHPAPGTPSRHSAQVRSPGAPSCLHFSVRLSAGPRPRAAAHWCPCRRAALASLPSPARLLLTPSGTLPLSLCLPLQLEGERAEPSSACVQLPCRCDTCHLVCLAVAETGVGGLTWDPHTSPPPPHPTAGVARELISSTRYRSALKWKGTFIYKLWPPGSRVQILVWPF